MKVVNAPAAFILHPSSFILSVPSATTDGLKRQSAEHRKRGGMAAAALQIIAALVMLALSARQMLLRGAPARAKTIASRTGLSPKASENALLLLERARREIPAGATVVFLDDRKPGSATVNYAVAVGQLPKHRVLPAELAEQAQYVILLHGG